MHRLSTGRIVVGYAYRVNYNGSHRKPWYRSLFREIGEGLRLALGGALTA